MRKLPRVAISLLCAYSFVAMTPLVADDGVDLEAQPGVAPGEIRLLWTGGGPGYRLYRATSPQHLVDPLNQIGATSGSSWSDTPPAGFLHYYRVEGPCQTPSVERCDGVDDDCNAIIDDGCGPCASNADCHAYDAPPVCASAATCQGTRQEGVCGGNQQCSPIAADDDSACSGLPSADCGPYPGLTCTSAASQPADQSSLCAASCPNDSACDPAGHCDETQSLCLDDFAPGFACLTAGDCQSDNCVDGVCCESACTGTCSACDLATPGICSVVPDGQDPDTECAGQSCVNWYWGFLGDTCYRKADVPATQASCGGDGACRTNAEECAAQTTRGAAELTCNTLCQDPSPGTCAGTTAGQCANVNPGTQTCGTGACARTVNQCSGGAPLTCTPGTPTTETCNDIDDNCDGTIDNGAFADSFEPNDSCSDFKTLPTVGSDQTLSQSSLTIYPSGDPDLFRIFANETDSSCACCDFFCTDEDYRLSVTLTVPAGAGSYNFCASTGCGTWTSCQTVAAGQNFTWTFALDGVCPTQDSYTIYVRITPGSAPGFECRPYTLSYHFDAGICL